jgi:hypothetical protein
MIETSNNLTQVRAGQWPTVSYSVTASGILAEPSIQTGKRLERNVNGALNDVIGAAYKTIRLAIPVRHKDGQRSQVHFHPAKISTVGARVETASQKMVFLEKDTKAHEIRAVRARALRFVIRGKTIFAKSVQHPGTRGKHMWQRADAQVRERLIRRIDAAITSLFHGVSYVKRYK